MYTAKGALVSERLLLVFQPLLHLAHVGLSLDRLGRRLLVIAGLGFGESLRLGSLVVG